MKQIIFGILISIGSFGQSDTLNSKSLSKLSYAAAHDLFKSGVTTFFVLEDFCDGLLEMGGKYDSCNTSSFKGYVLYKLANDSMTVRGFSYCGLSKEEKRIPVGSLKYFAPNRVIPRNEKFEFKTGTSHDCSIRFYEIENKKLLTILHFRNAWIDYNKKYEKKNKQLKTYKLLTGLRAELCRFHFSVMSPGSGTLR